MAGRIAGSIAGPMGMALSHRFFYNRNCANNKAQQPRYICNTFALSISWQTRLKTNSHCQIGFQQSLRVRHVANTAQLFSTN
jgi:hypothetical protein